MLFYSEELVNNSNLSICSLKNPFFCHFFLIESYFDALWLCLVPKIFFFHLRASCMLYDIFNLRLIFRYFSHFSPTHSCARHRFFQCQADLEYDVMHFFNIVPCSGFVKKLASIFFLWHNATFTSL